VVDGRVLSIAGSDSGGGAGIQADIKTITALGGYASSAVTALTAQNTLGVIESMAVDALFVERQIDAVLDDIGADAIKTGMLVDHVTVELVARRIEAKARTIPLIVDPVMISSSGHTLLDARGRDVLRRRLLPISALITPNIDEASVLTGIEITDEGDMHRAADQLLLLGANAVLITGGHLLCEQVVDLLRTADGLERRFENERQTTSCTHGTGCTLSAAIATGIAQGLTLESAVERGITFVQDAMRWAVRLGHGQQGPLDHGFCLRERPARAPVH
jgi:hydroxymethylpyrimidine/phosphomethylpyrimidine kinase